VTSYDLDLLITEHMQYICRVIDSFNSQNDLEDHTVIGDRVITQRTYNFEIGLDNICNYTSIPRQRRYI